MRTVDYDCFVGGWPFHKVRRNTLEDLMTLHHENGIESGYVSSTDAIFYNDPYEADKELSGILEGSNYHHVITMNPTLPGTLVDLSHALKEFKVAGVRLLPGFHGYSLQDECVQTLCEEMARQKLPLFLTLRLEDERCTYLFHPQPVELADVQTFIEKNKELAIVLCNMQLHEFTQLKDCIKDSDHVVCDSCGLKDGLFPFEEIENLGLMKKMVYGSLAPLFCLKSSLLLVEEDQLAAEDKEAIQSGEAYHRMMRLIYHA